jgi:hypothetical protein
LTKTPRRTKRQLVFSRERHLLTTLISSGRLSLATEPGFVFIHSKLDPNLVVDAQGNTGLEGELLAMFPQNGGPNQQWSFQPLFATLSGPGMPGVIQSLMGNNLVMDVPDFDSTKQLQVFPQNDGTNQQWILLPAQQEGSNATVTVFPVVGAAQPQVTLIGTGFDPGTGVIGNYLFTGPPSSGPAGTGGDFNTVTDLTGGWRSTNRVDELVPGGDLAVHLDFSFPLVGPFLFLWDGSTFKRE